jgi:hypothetical protein
VWASTACDSRRTADTGRAHPDRTARIRVRDVVPGHDLAHLLIHRVGVDERVVASMSKQEAIERLNRYWTHGT